MTQEAIKSDIFVKMKENCLSLKNCVFKIPEYMISSIKLSFLNKKSRALKNF